jgi:molecular chaperone GrpE (heat shock protein)
LRVLEEIRQKLEADRFREGVITRLQEELEAHRQGQADRLLLPLVTGVVRLHADVGRMLDALHREPPEKLTPDRFLKWVDDFRGDLELVLDHGGVTLYTEPGTAFNPHRQVAQRTAPTADAALAGQVAERLQPGFERNGRVIEKERVSVFVQVAESAP